MVTLFPGHYASEQLRVGGGFLDSSFSQNPLLGGILESSGIILFHDFRLAGEWRSHGGGIQRNVFLKFLGGAYRWIFRLYGVSFMFDGVGVPVSLGRSTLQASVGSPSTGSREESSSTDPPLSPLEVYFMFVCSAEKQLDPPLSTDNAG